MTSEKAQINFRVSTSLKKTFDELLDKDVMFSSSADFFQYCLRTYILTKKGFDVSGNIAIKKTPERAKRLRPEKPEPEKKPSKTKKK